MLLLLLLVLQSIAKIITKYYNQFQTIIINYKLLQSITNYYNQLQCITINYNLLQLITINSIPDGPPNLLRPPMFATDKSLLQFRNVKHILNKSKQSKQKANQQYKIYLISLMIDKIK